MIKRPCECGCKWEDHSVAGIDGVTKALLTGYCSNCYKYDMWCYFYRPIDNLKYLEYLYEQSK